MKSNLKFIIYLVYMMLAHHANAMVGPEEKPLEQTKGAPISLSNQSMLRALISQKEIPIVLYDLKKKYDLLKNYDALGLSAEEANRVYIKLLSLNQEQFETLMMLINKIQDYISIENRKLFRKHLRDTSPGGIVQSRKTYIRAALDVALNLFRPQPLSRSIFSIKSSSLSDIAALFPDFREAHNKFLQIYGLEKK